MRKLLFIIFLEIFLAPLHVVCGSDMGVHVFCNKALEDIKQVYIKPIAIESQEVSVVSIEEAGYGVVLPKYLMKSVRATGNVENNYNYKYEYEYDGINVLIFSDNIPTKNEELASKNIIDMKYALSVFDKDLEVECELLDQRQIMAIYLWGSVLYKDKMKKTEYIAIDDTYSSFFRKYYDLQFNEFVWEYNFIQKNDVIAMLLRADNDVGGINDLAKYIYEINIRKLK
jgi:hypothetical protein